MSFETFKACVDKLPQNVDVGFAGMCEPWINPDCTKMVIYAHKQGHRIEVFTTLVGMKPSDIDQLANIPIAVFCVHLPSAGNFENITVDERYLATLDKLFNSRINASYLFNGEELHPKIDRLMQHNAQKFYQNHLCTRANNIELENMGEVQRMRGILGCKRKLRYNVLLPNGEVTICCMDYGLKHVLGNLLTSNYSSLFHGREFRTIQIGLWMESKNIICRYCDAWAYDVVDQLRQDVRDYIENRKLLLKLARSLKRVEKNLFRNN